MAKGLTILCAAKLHENQLERHLELFESIDDIDKVLVVRRSPLGERLTKLEQHTFRQGTLLGEALRLTGTIDALVRSQRVDWIVGFNPVPWGSLALLSAKRRTIPCCLSLIGMDYLQIQKTWGRPFLESIRHADAVTVTGSKMKVGLEARGIASERIRILPHSVDTRRFSPTDGEKKYDIISVGQLIQRKRMDILIAAVSELARNGIKLKVGILGRGPLESELRDQARASGVSDSIEFLGFRDDVEAVLSSARAFCLASQWEGVPFAMMEAMSAGVVPVVTDVGTISDWVRHGENGLITEVGDEKGLARALARLFSEEGRELARLRARLIAERERLSFEQGAQVWRDIFGL